MLAITCAAFLALFFNQAMSLTDDQIAQFRTTGITNMNTGVVGTVTFAPTTYHGMDALTITSNGIPDHATGVFPSRHNPNYVTVQSYSYVIPRTPTVAASPSCLSMGPIGICTNGVPIFNLMSDEDTDATITEVFDSCNGHPTPRGEYHYHMDPVCLNNILGNPAGLVGVALDGFAIYGRVDENGVELTSADLDECHGHAPNGEEYHYHITTDSPYTLGCYKGTSNSRVTPRKCFFLGATPAGRR